MRNSDMGKQDKSFPNTRNRRKKGNGGPNGATLNAETRGQAENMSIPERKGPAMDTRLVEMRTAGPNTDHEAAFWVDVPEQLDKWRPGGPSPLW